MVVWLYYRWYSCVTKAVVLSFAINEQSIKYLKTLYVVISRSEATRNLFPSFPNSGAVPPLPKFQFGKEIVTRNSVSKNYRQNGNLGHTYYPDITRMCVLIVQNVSPLRGLLFFGGWLETLHPYGVYVYSVISTAGEILVAGTTDNTAKISRHQFPEMTSRYVQAQVASTCGMMLIKQNSL